MEEYAEVAANRSISAQMHEELFHVRQYLFLSATYLKVAIELIRMDMNAGNDMHIGIVDEITYNYFNKYRWDFFNEYDRIAEKYGLPKTGE